MAERIYRDADLRIKVSPDVKERLHSMADRYGVPAATLAAVWLSQRLVNEEAALGTSGALLEHIGRALSKSMQEQGVLLDQVQTTPLQVTEGA